MDAAEEGAAAAAADGGSGGGSSGAGSSEGGARRRFDDKGLVARTSLILWHTHQNDVGAVRKLLEEDAALVNARDYDSRTPLHVAALHGWHDVAECLIANGADVNSQDRWQNTVGGWEWGGPVSSDDPRLPLASAFDLHALSVLCLFRCRGLDLGRCCALGSLFSCWNDLEVSDPTLFCWDTIGLSNLTIWKDTRSATSTLCSFSSYYCVVLLSALLHLRNLQIALRIHGVSRLLCWLVKCTGATMIGICILVMP